MANDPWALLAEIHELQPWLSQDADLAARVEAALAGRAEGSTEDVVKWRPSNQRVFLDGVDLRILYQTDGTWLWSVYWPLSHRTDRGACATEAEAKTAAIAAARGLK